MVGHIVAFVLGVVLGGAAAYIYINVTGKLK